MPAPKGHKIPNAKPIGTARPQPSGAAKSAGKKKAKALKETFKDIALRLLSGKSDVKVYGKPTGKEKNGLIEVIFEMPTYEKLVLATVANAMKGGATLNELLNRVEGKVPDKVDNTLKGGIEIVIKGPPVKK